MIILEVLFASLEGSLLNFESRRITDIRSEHEQSEASEVVIKLGRELSYEMQRSGNGWCWIYRMKLSGQSFVRRLLCHSLGCALAAR